MWASYALGAGRGSKVAAGNLIRRDTSWATNFFESDRATYVQGGGNGAAMRIQPHVWSARPDISLEDLLSVVVADSVVTHGHTRGILGAAFHALTLRRALHDGELPGPVEWRADLADLMAIVDVVEGHDELGGLWLGMWQQRTGRSLRDATVEVIEELAADIDALERTRGRELVGAYGSAIEALGAFKPSQRGSGTKTALLASYLAWRAEGNARGAVVVAANGLGTDTDSIATMAGAIMGALGIDPPDDYIADRHYIEHEADRMFAHASGETVEQFPHPDLRRWQPPKSQSDALGTSDDGRLHLAGLGPVEPASEVHGTSGKNAPGWQWVDLWFGQRVLAKRRAQPPTLDQSQLTMPSNAYTTSSLLDDAAFAQGATADEPLVEDRRRGEQPRGESALPRNLHDLTNEAIRSGFDPVVIGHHMIELSANEQGVELSMAYSAILAKALMSRRDAQRRAGRV